VHEVRAFADDGGVMRTPLRGPLVVTGSDTISATLVRAAAAAGVVPDVVREPAAALDAWSSASVVLIGADQTAEMAALGLQRRGHVYVVSDVPLAEDAFRLAIGCGADGVLELPNAQDHLVDLLTDAADGGGELGQVIGVVGGAGGVGASTFAAALAATLARDDGALLLDADPDGGGVDHVLGLEPGTGVRWDALTQAGGRLSARSLREALPRRELLSVLTWPVERDPVLPLQTLRAALSAGQRGYRSVVVDVPRTDRAVADELLARCDRVVLISTLTVPALASSAIVAKRLPANRTEVVLRGRGGVATPQVEGLLRLSVAHRMHDQRGLDEAISLGLGPLRSRRGPLSRAARRMAASIARETAR
jgi:secretion/DNA translocation related CpaE-like protein